MLPLTSRTSVSPCCSMEFVPVFAVLNPDDNRELSTLSVFRKPLVVEPDCSLLVRQGNISSPWSLLMTSFKLHALAVTCLSFASMPSPPPPIFHAAPVPEADPG